MNVWNIWMNIWIKIIQRTYSILVDCCHCIRGRKRSLENTDSGKRSENGTLYERLLLVSLTKKAHELSKVDSRFMNFAIGREVKIGHRKLDDIVFRYEDNNNQVNSAGGMTPTKNLIFGQIKHKKDSSLKINHDCLTKAKMSGNMGRDFNLLQYVISFRTIRDELKTTRSKQFKNGKIKYVAIFTNADIDSKDLKDKGCSLKEAPADIKELFAQETNHFYQFGSVSDDLKNIFKKSSDLHIIAREFAQFVVSEKYEQKKTFTMGSNKAKYHYIIKKYEGALGNEVVTKTKRYGIACFKKDFIDNQKPGSKKELRDAIFEAIRELDELKKDLSEDELKEVLRKAKWQIEHNFGGNRKDNLPDKWLSIVDKDIDDFLECLVFSVCQPKVEDLLSQISCKVNNFFLRSTPVEEALDIMDEKFKDRLLKALGVPRREENWITGKQIEEFVEEQQEALNCIINTSWYEDKTMEYGEFNRLGKITVSLDNFLNYQRNQKIKVFCISSAMTLLTAVKILQCLNDKNHKAKNDHISVKLDDLKSEKITERVEKAFRSENLNLLTIECTGDFNEKPERIADLYYRFSKIIKDKKNPNKKIILIAEEKNLNILTTKIRNHLSKFPEKHKKIPNPSDLCVHETDDIIVKDFKPKEDPFTKEIIVFQGQEEISLATLTGILNWESYVTDSSLNGIQNEENILEAPIIDAPTLVEILKSGEITVGSRPLGTDSLECAYASLPEEIKEINKENLVKKLLQQGPDSNTDAIYIVSGILGSNGNEKMKNMIQYLGLIWKEEEIKRHFGDIGNGSRIQVASDTFIDKDFKDICRRHPEKEVFWICIKDENEFLLEKFYNPCFYLKIISKNELRELSTGPICNFLEYTEESQTTSIEEENLIKQIRNSEIVIIIGDPGTGKTAELTKFYETKYESISFIKSSWIIRINLRNHGPAIKKIEMVNRIIDVVHFMSEIDSELNNSLSKSLLINALCNKDFSKPLLLVVDGFDEVSSKKDRVNVISFLKFIKEKTASKLWVSSRRHYKDTLEKELSTFAIELKPLNDKSAVAYIEKYLKDRLCLILTEEHFADNYENQGDKSIRKYANAFLNKMKSVFGYDMSGFVGTPLLFNIMLNNLEMHFKNWMENNMDQDLTFNYLGNDVQVYEKIIKGMLDFSCEKYRHVTDEKFWKAHEEIFREYRQKIAECLIFEEPDETFEEIDELFEELKEKDLHDMVFLTGIIKSDGSSIEFFPSKLKDFFVAELFVNLLEERKNRATNKELNKHLLKVILKKPDYKPVRGIINVKLNNVMETEKFKKCLNFYGPIIEELLEEEESSFSYEKGTVLHIAVTEGNKNIVQFLLESLKGHTIALKKFLVTIDKDKRTPLNLAQNRGDDEIVKLLLDAEAELLKITGGH